MEICLKVGDSRYQIDPLWQRSARDGNPLAIMPDGTKWGRLDMQHHCVIRTTDNYELFRKDAQKYLTFVNDDWRAKYEIILTANVQDFEPYKYRAYFVDFGLLYQNGIITKSQYEQIYNKDVSTGVISLNRSILDIFKNEQTDIRLEVKKNMAVASGTYNIGSGLDYANHQLGMADIDAGGLTGNLTFQQANEEVAEGSDHAITEALGGYTLTFTAQAGAEHNGGAYGNGARIAFGSTYNEFFYNNGMATGTGKVVISKLAFSLSGASNTIAYIRAADGHVFEIFRNLAKGGNNNAERFCFQYSSTSTLLAYNNILYDIGATDVTSGGIICDNQYDALTAEIYNNTVINCYIGLGLRSDYTNGTQTFKNNITQNCTTGYSNPANFDVTAKNISEDATSPDVGYSEIDLHTNSVFENYAGDDYRLDVEGDETNLAIVDDGDDLSGIFTNDIIGTIRSTWYIGAFELVSGEGGETSLTLGSFPSPLGALNFAIGFNITSSLPAPSGEILKGIKTSLSGVLGSITGVVTEGALGFQQGVTGSFPTPGGGLTKKIGFYLGGTFGIISSTIQRAIAFTLNGDQPNPTGDSNTGWNTSESTTGEMPAPSGLISTILNPIISPIIALVKIIGSGYKKFIGG